MTCTVKVTAMRAALERAAGVVPTRSTMPVLQCVLLRAAQGRLTVSATDLDVWQETSVEASIEEPSAVAVDAHKLLLVFNALSTTQDAVLRKDGNALTIHQGRSQTRMLAAQAEEFPNKPPQPAGEPLVLGGPEMSAGLDLVVPFISTDEARAVLMGARMTWNGHTCMLTATTGQNLLQVALPRAAVYSRPPAWAAPALVPRRAAASIGRLRDQEQERISVMLDTHRVGFSSAGPGGALTARLIDGTYPDVDGAVLSKIMECGTVFGAPAAVLLDTLRRQTLVETGARIQATVEVSGGQVRLSSTGENTQWAEEESEFKAKGPDAKITIPLKWMVRLLTTVAATAPDQEVFIRFQDEASPLHMMTESRGGMVLHMVAAPIAPALVRKRAA